MALAWSMLRVILVAVNLVVVADFRGACRAAERRTTLASLQEPDRQRVALAAIELL